MIKRKIKSKKTKSAIKNRWRKHVFSPSTTVFLNMEKKARFMVKVVTSTKIQYYKTVSSYVKRYKSKTFKK